MCVCVCVCVCGWVCVCVCVHHTIQRNIIGGFSSHEGALHGMTLVLRPWLIVGLPAVQVDMAHETGDSVSLVDPSTREVGGVCKVEESSGCHGRGHCPAGVERERERLTHTHTHRTEHTHNPCVAISSSSVFSQPQSRPSYCPSPHHPLPAVSEVGRGQGGANEGGDKWLPLAVRRGRRSQRKGRGGQRWHQHLLGELSSLSGDGQRERRADGQDLRMILSPTVWVERVCVCECVCV